jgi:uncharacterized protein YbjT (DUF2867 family)
MKSKNILLAGATGYLGNFIARELKSQGHHLTVLVRNEKKLSTLGIEADKIINAQITSKSELVNCCMNIDVVISTVGITRQKDGLSYMDVDYQGNKNLLEEAKKSSVQKFIYVSALNGDQLRNLKIFEAKEKFVDELKQSGLEYCVVRPNGFFSDISELFYMAKSGRVYLFGDGNLKSNPIHGEDLAKVCLEGIENSEHEVIVGGPEILSQKEIANIAFEAIGKPSKITFIPDWVRKTVLFFGKFFIPSKTFGPIEFFMTVLAKEMIAPKYGTHIIKDFFKKLAKG